MTKSAFFALRTSQGLGSKSLGQASVALDQLGASVVRTRNLQWRLRAGPLPVTSWLAVACARQPSLPWPLVGLLHTFYLCAIPHKAGVCVASHFHRRLGRKNLMTLDGQEYPLGALSRSNASHVLDLVDFYLLVLAGNVSL